MSGFEKIKEEAGVLIENHNKEIEQKYGKGYNSPHEWHSVEREEVQEVEENLNELKNLVEEKLWFQIRNNVEITEGNLDEVILLAKEVIAEAVQVGAVALRMKHGIEEKTKE